MGGGPSTPAQTTSTQTQELPPWATSIAQTLIGDALKQRNKPYTPYTGKRIADAPAFFNEALQGTKDITRSALPAVAGAAKTVQGISATPATARPGLATAQQISKTSAAAQPGLATAQKAAAAPARNPYAQQLGLTIAGQGSQSGALNRLDPLINTNRTLDPTQAYINPILAGKAQNALNPELFTAASGKYLSPDSNPYLKQTFQQAADEVTGAYSRGTAAQTAAAAARAGALGGSAYQEQVGVNQEALGKTLSGLATDIYGGAYQTERDRMLSAAGQYSQNQQSEIAQRLQAAGLSQEGYNAMTQNKLAAIGQKQAASEFTTGSKLQALGLGQQWSQDALNRQLQAAGMSSDIYGQGINQRLQGAGLANDIYGQGISQQMQAAGMLPGMYQQQQQLYQPGVNMAMFNRDLTQQGLDLQYANWKERQDYPYRTMDMLGSALSQALGHNAGTTTTTQPYFQPQYNPIGGAFAGGLAGYGATNSGWGAGLGALLGGLGGQ